MVQPPTPGCCAQVYRVNVLIGWMAVQERRLPSNASLLICELEPQTSQDLSLRMLEYNGNLLHCADEHDFSGMDPF